MKNKLLILLSVLLCLAMVGCGDKGNAEKQTEKTTTTTTTAQQEIALDLKYVAYGNGRDMHKGKEITDAEIIRKIENFITAFQKYPVEAESRGEDIPKGGSIKIVINNGKEMYKSVSIATPDLERVGFTDYSGGEKTGGYYYTDNNLTIDFYGEMTEYFKSQGWVG